MGTTAAAAADDATNAAAANDATTAAGLLQFDEDDDKMCTSVTEGDVVPINGFFNGEAVSMGDVAQQSGTFCVDKDVMALAQRSFGFESAQDIEDAVVAKKKTTTPSKKEVAEAGRYDF